MSDPGVSAMAATAPVGELTPVRERQLARRARRVYEDQNGRVCDCGRYLRRDVQRSRVYGWERARNLAERTYAAALESPEQAYQAIKRPAELAYQAVKKPAEQAYQAAVALAVQTYRPALKATIVSARAARTYRTAVALAVQTYQAIVEPARQAYDAATDPAREAYLAAREPAEQAYQVAIAPSQLSLDECDLLIARAVSFYGSHPVWHVGAGGPGKRCASEAIDFRTGEYLLEFGPGTRTREGVLHEAAHMLDSENAESECEAHGPDFMAVYVDLLIEFTGADGADLLASAERAGIRVSRLIRNNTRPGADR